MKATTGKDCDAIGSRSPKRKSKAEMKVEGVTAQPMVSPTAPTLVMGEEEDKSSSKAPSLCPRLWPEVKVI